MLNQSLSNVARSPTFPNASYTAWMERAGKAWFVTTSTSCGVATDPEAGCLFNIKDDETGVCFGHMQLHIDASSLVRLEWY